MPKRIINGEALWRSDKLAKVNPPKFRAEYANILPLALANGVFEVNPSRVWSEVYSYNRTDVSRGEVAKILQAFEDVGLLFRWTDDTGKAWGYWTGSEKPGRLPSRSMRKHYEVGPTPPQDQLSAYLQRNGHSRPEQPVDPTPEKRKPTKTTLPDGFGISEAVREWAKQNGYTRLQEHLECFIGYAKAHGKTYADWDQAFKNCIRDNWAKLDNSTSQVVGQGLLERTRAALRMD